MSAPAAMPCLPAVSPRGQAPSASWRRRLRLRRTPECSCRVPPSRLILVKLIPAPTADCNDRLGSQSLHEGGSGATRDPAILLHRHNLGDRFAMRRYDIAMPLADYAEELRELAVCISGGNRLFHNQLQNVVILRTMSYGRANGNRPFSAHTIA